MARITYGEGRHLVRLDVHETEGNGVCLFVRGGEVPHVGGVAMAVPRPSLTGTGTSCDVHQLCAPGHKDVDIAASIARRVSSRLCEVAVVTVGIHVDHASQGDISKLTGHAESAVDAWLDQRIAAPVEKIS